MQTFLSAQKTNEGINMKNVVDVSLDLNLQLLIECFGFLQNLRIRALQYVHDRER